MKILEDIGFSKIEVKVYTYLVKEGEVSAGKIIKETKTHPQIIYRALDTLKMKGLVFEYTKKSKKLFKAESPERLLKMEEEKMSDLRFVVSKLRSLEALSKDALVKVYRGNDEVVLLRKRAFTEMKKGDTYYIIGASGDRFYEIVGENFETLERMRVKKGIKKKMLVYKNTVKDVLKKEKFKEFLDIRVLQEEFRVPTSTNIFGNTVAILIWEFDPIVITIESKSVVESYKQYFEMLWKVKVR